MRPQFTLVRVPTDGLMIAVRLSAHAVVKVTVNVGVVKMWMLVVFVAGMSVYTNTYNSYEACEQAGRARAWDLAAKGKLGAGWNCTRIK